MAVSFLSPSRSVLLIGDEALYVYDVSSRGTRLVDTVPWHVPDFANVTAQLIRKECGSKPVLILNDMTDQHFKGGQRLPKVSIMDKNNVLARKLMVAFPNYPIRGALAVKETKTADRKAKKTPLYLYAAVPMSEPVAKTIEAVKNSVLPITGFFLLPVESADMVKALSARLAGKKQKTSRWVIFIGQHHNGALRQVIIRDGQLAMTRMTPVADTDSDSSAWAGEVSQELKATISYLSRFGFTPDDGADIILISSPEAGQAFEQMIDIPCQYTHLTAPEAARELGMKLGMQDDPRYADPLHAAWVGRKTKFILPMKAKELEKVHRPRQAASAAAFLLFLGAGYFGWQTAGHLETMFTVQDDLETQKRQLVQAERAYEEEVERMRAIGFDVKLVQGAIKSYEKMEERRLKALSFIKTVDGALGNDLRLDAFSIDYTLPPAPEPSRFGRSRQEPEEPKPTIKAALKISFPPTVDPPEGVREVNSLQRRLQQVFPGYKVLIEKNVAGLEYDATIKGQTGQSAREIAKEDNVAVLVIEGAMQ